MYRGERPPIEFWILPGGRFNVTGESVVGVTRTDSGELGSTRTDTTTDGRIRVGSEKEHYEKLRAQT